MSSLVIKLKYIMLNHVSLLLTHSIADDFETNHMTISEYLHKTQRVHGFTWNCMGSLEIAGSTF